MRDPIEIVEAFGGFDEAILRDFRFVGSTFVLEMVFDVTWSLRHLGQKTTEGQLVELTFTGVDEVRVRNDFPPTIVDASQIGWSHNEVALAVAGADDLPRAEAGRQWLSFLWERDQRIDILFREVVAGWVTPGG